MRSRIDFMAHRRLAAVASIAFVLLSLAALGINGFNAGLDFTGGTLVEITSPDPIPAATAREDLQRAGFTDATVQQSGTERDLVVRIPVRPELEAFRIGDGVVAALKAAHPGVELVRAEFVGPAVGEDLRDSGILSMLLAMIATGAYIAWRFTGKFAVAATIALAHDVVITLGAFALFRWRFDLASLAAVLTVIGYSLNDTIVICDRIRENLRSQRKAPLLEVINLSLNQTLERTLIMSFTTLSVLIALLVFGGADLRGFSAALTVGVVAGTYSSVYIAAAYLVLAKLSSADLIVAVESDSQP